LGRVRGRPRAARRLPARARRPDRGLAGQVFAAHGRVRPYNNWLAWELRTHPLGELWSAESLLPRLDRIVATGEVEEQRALFRLTEPFARKRGFGDVIDEWEPDVAFMRGGD
jgi:hypothetical protein